MRGCQWAGHRLDDFSHGETQKTLAQSPELTQFAGDSRVLGGELRWVNGRDGSDGVGGIGIGRFAESERFGGVVDWNWIPISGEFPGQQIQFGLGEFDGTTKNSQ